MRITIKIISLIMSVAMVFTSIPFAAKGYDISKTIISDCKVGDIIEFGSYPQSEVKDSALLSALNSLSLNWGSYNYYSGTGNWKDGKMKSGDWMKYADVTYENIKYRAVKFTEYRPNNVCLIGSADNSYQDDNGYYIDTIYWFEYEPLKWKVADPETGYLLCADIIDAQPYSNFICYSYSMANGVNYTDYNSVGCTSFANDYETSSVRAWLNGSFYNIAFTAEEKNCIITSALDNNSYYSNQPLLNGNTTYDKVFIPSYDEIKEYYPATDMSPARSAKGSDYAKCQGIDVYIGSSTMYYGNSLWALRTTCNNSRDICLVSSFGTIRGNNYNCTDYVDNIYGIRPAIKITEIEKKIYKICDREFENNLDFYAEELTSSNYSPVLANMMAALSKAVYSENDINSASESLGFETYGVYDFESNYNPHTCGYSLAFKKSDYSDDIICLVSVRGTQTLNYNADWIGNLELATFEDEKHIGFAYPANRIYETVQKVVGDKGLNVKYFITGHSRGGAVANLLSVKLMENGVSSSNIYNYNFACPDVACKVYFSKYSNIFNLCNREDIVPFVPGNFASALTSPGTSWGKFGKTYWFTKDAPDTVNPIADHSMDLYLEFFDRQLDLSDWGETVEDKFFDTVHMITGWIMKVKCPVDVIITDENGNSIASVIGGEVNYYNSQVGDVLIFTDGDKKVIYINGDNDFNVNLIGTDSGEMTYSVEKYNVQSEEVLESKTFANVKLEEGKQMFSPVSNADNADDVELFVTETQNGQQVITHTISTSGTETAVENETPDEPSDPSIDLNEITLKINKPSKTKINFGETLALQLNEIEIPEGYAVAWFVEGAGVSTWVSEDGLECRVTSIANGNATIYAKLVDTDENIVTNADGEEIFDEITVTSKAGFWQRFISFFKNLFGINRVIY